MLKKLSKILAVAMTISLLASLLVVSAPAAALGQPAVTVGTPTISQTSTYTVRVEIDKELGNGDTITITFPAGTAVPTKALLVNNTDYTIAASDGWIGGAYGNAVLAGVTLAGDATTRTVVATLAGGADAIGEGAEVRIEFLNPVGFQITNPSDIGTYSLTVKTNEEPTAVTSNTYDIAAPVVGALPGIVSLYNPSGILMNQWTGDTAINNAIGAVTASGSKIEVGPGTYDTDVALAGLGGTNLIGVGEVIITGTMTSSATTAGQTTVIDNLILKPDVAAQSALIITGASTTVQNCTITPGALVALGAAPLVNVNAATVTLTGNTIEATATVPVADTLVQVNAGPATISENTITGDTDVAIDVPTASTATISNNALTGAGGVGIQNAANVGSTMTISGNTLDGYTNGIVINNNAAVACTITENTIMNSIVAPGTVLATPPTAAVELTLLGSLTTLEKNVIKDNAGFSLAVQAVGGANFLALTGNEMMGNAFGIANYDAGNPLNAILNYWGANSGPTLAANPDGTGDPIAAIAGTVVNYTPWTNTTTTNVAANLNCPAAGTLDRSTTIGVVYTSTAGPTAGIYLMNYSSNPALSAPPGAAINGGYYDIYSPNAVGTNTLQFYNANIDADTKIYYYNALSQSWTAAANQWVAGNGAYVYCTTGVAPTNAELNGTIFALVDMKTIPNPPAINTPTIGATDVSIEPMFTWAAVPGAVRYEISVADDPSFTFLTLSHNVEGITFYKADADNEEALDYDTTYYWRVRAVLEDSYAAATPATAYVTGIFTTAMEPTEETVAETPVEVVVDPVKPEVNVEIPPTKITVEPAGAAIPTYILWIIVVVGAVLIIALIVLIVRTRRVA